jgi:hypothetical protein
MSPTWMNRPKEAEAARQAAIRERRQRAGNCIRCGFARDEHSDQLCTRHLLEQRTKRLESWRAKHPDAKVRKK